jgi:hypothetical protein
MLVKGFSTPQRGVCARLDVRFPERDMYIDRDDRGGFIVRCTSITAARPSNSTLAVIAVTGENRPTDNNPRIDAGPRAGAGDAVLMI